MLLETESREVYSLTENLGLGKNTDTTNTVDLHLHVGVTVRVTEIGQMRTPGSVFCVTFDNDSILIQSVC